MSLPKKIFLFHRTRGGYGEIENILKSEEKEVRGGKIGQAPTYSMLPAGVYWSQEDSAGFGHSLKRKNIKFPGEKETIDAIVYADERGIINHSIPRSSVAG